MMLEVKRLACGLFASWAFILVVPTSSSAQNTAPIGESEFVRVQVDALDAEQLHGVLDRLGIDSCDGQIDGHQAHIIVNAVQHQWLIEQGCSVQVLQRSEPMAQIIARRQGGHGPDQGPDYPDLDAVLSQMQDAATNYPGLCELVDITDRYNMPTTFEGRHLFAVKISDNVQQDEDEPAILIVSAHHSRELVTPVIALDAMERLLSGYAGDPTIRAVVDANEIWIAPVWNPDGYEYVFTTNNMWRKNRRVFSQGIGVDQNRNYPLGWEASCSGSNNPDSEVYKGPAPASEPETQTLMVWADDVRFAKVLDYHSSGRQALYSYNCSDHPYIDYLEDEATALAQASSYSEVRVPSAEGEHFQWQGGVFGAQSFLIETHTEFQPSYQSAVQEAARVWPGIVWMLDHPIALSGLVRDASSGDPVAASITPLGVDFVLGETNSSSADTGRYYAALPEGSHDMLFEAEGYQSRVVPVQISAGAPSVVDLAMNRVLIAFEFPSGVPNVVHPRLERFPIIIQEAEPGALVPESAMLHYGPVGGPYESTNLVSIGGNGWLGVFGLTACRENVSFWLSARDTNGFEIVSPPGAPIETYQALSSTGTQTVLSDNFELDRGWTTAINGATAGQWQRGVPIDDPQWQYDPSTDGDGSGQAFLTQNEPGNTDVDNGSVILTSPVFDLSDGGASISYWYYLFLTNEDGADRLLVEMSSNGLSGPWTSVIAHTTSGGLSWRTHTITQADLDAANINLTSNMAMRFTANDANPQSIVEAGVDGVVITTIECDPFPVLTVGELVGGQTGQFDVQRGTPNEPTYLAYSLRGFGTTIVPQLNVTLDLSRPIQAGNARRTDGQGRVQWTLPIPDVHGVGVWFQAAQRGRTSNVVQSTVN